MVVLADDEDGEDKKREDDEAGAEAAVGEERVRAGLLLRD